MTDNNYPAVKAPKADRRRAAYRNRMAKHLERLHNKERKHGLRL